MSLKIKFFHQNLLKKDLRKPYEKVIRAAARFVKYESANLNIYYSWMRKNKGLCHYGSAITLSIHNFVGTTTLSRAMDFFQVCAHELCHCQDRLEGQSFTGRKKKWKNRPVEIAVFNRLYNLTDGKATKYHDDQWATEIDLPWYAEKAILELSYALEGEE